MKFNKEMAIILVLVSMLLSAIAVSFYFYKQNKTIAKNKNKMVTIYVAKNVIKKDTLIKAEHLGKTQIAKQYILNKPLVKKEILGKYAKETIFKNEILIKEKFSKNLSIKSDEKIIEHKYSSYNMSFGMFKNPNYSLRPGDTINIVSVFNRTNPPERDGSKNFSVRYVAKNIQILGFLRAGRTTTKPIVKKKITKVVKKKKVTQIVESKANEIILDLKSKTLLSLIDDYNKGKQLWMTKVSKEKEVVEKKVVKKKVATNNKKKVKRTYPLTWYRVKNTSNTKRALIEYKDKPTLNTSKSAVFTTSFDEVCNKKDQLLIGLSRKVYIRYAPSMKAKVSKVIYRNYVIPYTNVSTKNADWFRTCDGKFVHKNEVKKISYTKVEKLKSGK